MSINLEISRRQFLKSAPALVIAFGLPIDLPAQSTPALKTSGGPLPPNQLDSWLILHKDGGVTVLTGKVELGTGVSTSLRQIVAEELDYPFEKISWVQGDTANTVDQLPTFGSQTIKRGGSELRLAAAEAKARSEPPRCAGSARRKIVSPTSRSWTSWPQLRAPIPSSFACAT
jgi:hypothetical protein